MEVFILFYVGSVSVKKHITRSIKKKCIYFSIFFSLRLQKGIKMDVIARHLCLSLCYPCNLSALLPILGTLKTSMKHEDFPFHFGFSALFIDCLA